MSAVRRPAPPSASELHRRWLGLVTTDGPFLAVPALKRVWPQGMPALGGDRRALLTDARAAFERTWDRWHRRGDEAAGSAYAAARDTFVDLVLREVLGWGEPPWLARAEELWGDPMRTDPTEPTRVAVPVWRDPWMAVGSRTFTTDLLARVGMTNVFGEHPERYPHVSVEQVDAAGADVVLLPDEPYVFTEDDGPEAFASTPTRLVSGRLLTWYGPALLPAWEELAPSR